MDGMISNTHNYNIDRLPEPIQLALTQFQQITELLHHFIEKKESLDGKLEGETIIQKMTSLS